MRTELVTALKRKATEIIAELEADLERSSRSATVGQKALERAILISVTIEGTRQEAENSMIELRELARTAQVEALDEFIQRPRSLNPRYVMGEGKMRDVVIRECEVLDAVADELNSLLKPLVQHDLPGAAPT